MAAGRLAALAATIVLCLAPGCVPAFAQAGRESDVVGPAVAKALLIHGPTGAICRLAPIHCEIQAS